MCSVIEANTESVWPDHGGGAVLQRGRLGPVHHGLGPLVSGSLSAVSRQSEQRCDPLRLHIQDGVGVTHLLQVPEKTRKHQR